MTADELLRMPETPGKRFELWRGELREMTPAGFEHGRVAGNLFGLLWAHVRGRGGGAVCAAETGFRIERAPDTVLAPDVSFVRAGRLPESESGFFEGAPDLAAEVVSPGDRGADVEEKADRWLAAGTRLLWIVWPQTRSVVVRPPDTAAEFRHENHDLTGDDVVPGFHCRVADLFR